MSQLNLRTETTTKKCTVTDTLNRSDVSCMQSFIDELVQLATETGMLVNSRKTKEMFSSTSKVSTPSVTFSGAAIERVTTFKLLGVHVSNDLKWAQHIQVVSAKVSSRLYFLKQLKRAGAGIEDLLCFYCLQYAQLWSRHAQFGILV